MLRFGGWFWGTCVVVGVVLGLFGVEYNRWVGMLVGEGHDRGFMGFIVAFGCLVTISGMAVMMAAAGGWVLGVAVWLMCLGAFAASGTPMIWGSVGRFCRQRREGELESLGLVDYVSWIRYGDARGLENGKSSDGKDTLAPGGGQGAAGECGDSTGD